jgi:hypothetical protein
MTIDQITEIRSAELKAQNVRAEMDKTYKDYITHNLEPLRDKCDHLFPWGDKATRCDDFGVDCQICKKQVSRY